MRNLALTAAIALGLAGPALADPVLGTWQTVSDDNGNYGHIDVAPCGSKICGTLVKSFAAGGAAGPSGNIGKQIIWDMEAEGGGAYGGGKVWSPDRDKTYNSKMQLNGNTLAISGCILGICRDGGTWTRVN
ncbi:hypothetical protein SuNHUV7_27330 (plasmid) [Pseudoseohaeicola sp. NH-UV-7]|uniref:DUF2147 domain-containing protein n=1 Tax=unclassified Sulfitobacter TaxID=196795 RepID=UPI000E0ADA3F|nr:DUF2147 domain-containing protein [Sulfitobacter sp. JL08]AXI57003.1 DUF2147 domain-containing protein [Sulfitobacter sp. JL08]